jgi:hypothetical protein
MDAFESAMREHAPAWSAFDMRMMFAGYLERGFAADGKAVATLTTLVGRAPRAYEAFARETADTWSAYADNRPSPSRSLATQRRCGRSRKHHRVGEHRRPPFRRAEGHTNMQSHILPGGSLRRTVATLAAVAAFVLADRAANAETTYSSDYKYVDGATAHAEMVCATADLCGTIALGGGDLISIYAETANGCASPTLHVVHRRGTQLLLSYLLTPKNATEHRQASGGERPAAYGCHGAAAYVPFDRGRIRMAVFPLAAGGQLFVRFAAGFTFERTNAAPAIIKAL